MAPIPIKSFLEELKTLSKAGVTEAEELLKSFKSNIKSLDEIVTVFPVQKNKHGFLEIAENSVGYVNKVMREANLPELVKMSGKNVVYTSADVKAFKSLVSDTPELAYKEVGDLASSTKRSYPHLDLKEVDIPSMSETAAKDVKKVESNLLKYFKQGAVIGLTLGAVYVGVDWLTTATNKRKGCFMMTTINKKTTSCKVQAYSCIGSDGDLCQSALPYYNTTLIIMHAASLADTDSLKKKLSEVAGIQPSEMNSRLAEIIDNKYAEMDAYISTLTTKPTLSVCSIVHPDIENGKLPACRMCMPSDNPISTTYIDPNQYPDNVTFTCSINPSILDTVADAVISTGKDLLDGIGGGLFTLIKPLLIIGAIILVVAIVIWIVVKALSNKKKDDSDDYNNADAMNVNHMVKSY